VESNLGSSPGNAGSSGAETSPIQQAKEQTQQVVQKTQEMASQAADQARQQVKSQLENQKGRATDGLGSVAQAFRMTGEQLRGQDQAAIAGYADSLAEMVESFSGSLREKNIDQIVAEVESFGRRQPVLFLGGAFALGFLASRFLKSSSERERTYSYGGSTGNGYGSARNQFMPAANSSTAGTTSGDGSASTAAPSYERATGAPTAFEPVSGAGSGAGMEGADDGEEAESLAGTAKE